MLIVSVRDNENNRWKKNTKATTKNSNNNNKNKQKKRRRENRSCSESVRAKWFCCAFKLGFLQLMPKAFLTFKSNLELALSIILKERKLI